MADDYTPSEAEEWELADLLGTIIEDVGDEPQFTVSEHALMAAGTIRREWLAAHDARVRRDAARAALDGYADALNRNRSPAVWDWTDFVTDVREWAFYNYPEETP